MGKGIHMRLYVEFITTYESSNTLALSRFSRWCDELPRKSDEIIIDKIRYFVARVVWEENSDGSLRPMVYVDPPFE